LIVQAPHAVVQLEAEDDANAKERACEPRRGDAQIATGAREKRRLVHSEDIGVLAQRHSWLAVGIL
jgi:hypothetical protein